MLIAHFIAGHLYAIRVQVTAMWWPTYVSLNVWQYHNSKKPSRFMSYAESYARDIHSYSRWECSVLSWNDLDFLLPYCMMDAMNVQNQCPLPKECRVFVIFTRGELQLGKRLRFIMHTSKLIVALIETVTCWTTDLCSRCRQSCATLMIVWNGIHTIHYVLERTNKRTADTLKLTYRG